MLVPTLRSNRVLLPQNTTTQKELFAIPTARATILPVTAKVFFSIQQPRASDQESFVRQEPSAVAFVLQIYFRNHAIR